MRKSVTHTITQAMVFILLLFLTTVSFGIISLASSLDDAQVINVAGSMRMQSYRLAKDIQNQSVDIAERIIHFEHALYSPAIQALQKWYVPKNIYRDYVQLIEHWNELKKQLTDHNYVVYLQQVDHFAESIDAWVFKLQRFSEQKLLRLAIFGGLGLGLILLVMLFVIHYVRREIVRPLGYLISASKQVENQEFDILLPVQNENEMGLLTQTFNRMTSELGKLYKGLEEAVNEKTKKLQRLNQSLQVLYHSSQELSRSKINQDNLQIVLNYLLSLDAFSALKLVVNDKAGKDLVLQTGKPTPKMQREPLMLDGETLGYLYWHGEFSLENQALIDNFSGLFAKAIYYNQAQKQAEQLLLMQERATIARELHDSLAQSLSYLKIQVSLLKRTINKHPQKQPFENTLGYVSEIEQGLSEAYLQLRELLTTFRLTIKEGSFGEALKEMIRQLNDQSSAHISLDNQLSSIELDAHQQVHLLQLIREATINAIKHANAEHIAVYCAEQNEEVTVRIEDDGKGFEQHQSRLNHFGMSIMQERAAQLNGKLNIDSSLDNGCRVILKYKR